MQKGHLWSIGFIPLSVLSSLCNVFVFIPGYFLMMVNSWTLPFFTMFLSFSRSITDVGRLSVVLNHDAFHQLLLCDKCVSMSRICVSTCTRSKKKRPAQYLLCPVNSHQHNSRNRKQAGTHILYSIRSFASRSAPPSVPDASSTYSIAISRSRLFRSLGEHFTVPSM